MSKFSIITMVKNEMDILPLWLDYYKPYIDCFYIVDHFSDDGTYEYLLSLVKSGASIRLFRYNEQGYYQSEVLTRLAVDIQNNGVNTWVLPLDVDEFIKDLNKFIPFCNTLSPYSIIRLSWRNLCPMVINDFFDKSSREIFLKSPILDSKRGKVLFHSDSISNENFKITQGAHNILGKYNKKVNTNLSWELYHIPIRSRAQFLIKIYQGVLSYEKMNINFKKNKMGFHWFRMFNLLLDSNGDIDDLIRGYVAKYSRDVKIKELKLDFLLKQNWTLLLDFSLNQVNDQNPNYENLKKFIERNSTNQNNKILLFGDKLLKKLKEIEFFKSYEM